MQKEKERKKLKWAKQCGALKEQDPILIIDEFKSQKESKIEEKQSYLEKLEMSKNKREDTTDKHLTKDEMK